jgi:methyl-accepting chemotaxis protein PixJ
MDTRIRDSQRSGDRPPSPSSPKSSGGRGILRVFTDLPIGRKTQSITLLIFLALLGIAVGGAKVLEDSLRSRLQEQTKAALAVSELNYQNGIENMERSFASLAENPLVIEIARRSAAGQPLTDEQKALLKTILSKEAKIQDIEYATLIDLNSRIVANANPSDRAGEKFDPGGLVAQVLEQPRQLSSSEIVRWGELKKENAPLPGGLTNQDALIRYVITPIKSPETGRTLAVLVAGDIVNGDESIARRTVDAYGNEGYSAVYLDRGDGFSLATSIETTDLRQATRDVPLADNKLLGAASKARGKAVPPDGRFFRGRIGDRTYTLAARAIPNSEGKPVAVLVYGDPETALERVINTSFLTQGILSAIVLALVPGIAWLIGRSISSPIERLRKVTGEFARGNYRARATVHALDEVGQLARDFNEMADSIDRNNRDLVERAEMFRCLSRLAPNANAHGESSSAFLDRAVREARAILSADRLLVYRIGKDRLGHVAHESVGDPFVSALGGRAMDACIPETILNAYRQDRIVVFPDVTTADIHPDHRLLLDRLQVHASAIVPILDRGELFGLLIAHQCDGPREWQETEINFLQQVVNQIQIVLERIAQRQQIELESRLFARLNEITRALARSDEEIQLFETAVTESRQALQTDRVTIYRFDANWIGTFVAESVDSRYPTALGARVGDPCFAERFVEPYRLGRVRATPDVHAADLTDCHLQQLEPFAVKANLVTPLLVAGELYGLLIAHQCDGPRDWQRAEIDFLTQVAIQVGCAIERFHLWSGQKMAEEEQRQAREKLQQRAIELLMEVDPVSRGDLSIRATVTEDEIGTIADSYNATVESLRKIVTRVQSVSDRLTDTTKGSETSIRSLAERASLQLEEIRGTMGKIEEMRRAIALVADNARQASSTVHETIRAVSLSEDSMARTVDGMRSIQETVGRTARKIENLNESSRRISKVVNLIGRFAAQTHLLALKASIEAARAGEEGRGFAVIADEVRTLAAQSAEATAEIETLVLGIQNEAREVALTMESETEQVTLGSQLLEETRSGLERITAASRMIDELVGAIAESAALQTRTGQAVHHELLEVSAISEGTSLSAEEVTASFESLLQSARALAESVAQFKV